MSIEYDDRFQRVVIDGEDTLRGLFDEFNLLDYLNDLDAHTGIDLGGIPDADEYDLGSVRIVDGAIAVDLESGDAQDRDTPLDGKPTLEKIQGRVFDDEDLERISDKFHVGRMQARSIARHIVEEHGFVPDKLDDVDIGPDPENPNLDELRSLWEEDPDIDQVNEDSYDIEDKTTKTDVEATSSTSDGDESWEDVLSHFSDLCGRVPGLRDELEPAIDMIQDGLDDLDVDDRGIGESETPPTSPPVEWRTEHQGPLQNDRDVHPENDVNEEAVGSVEDFIDKSDSNVRLNEVDRREDEE